LVVFFAQKGGSQEEGLVLTGTNGARARKEFLSPKGRRRGKAKGSLWGERGAALCYELTTRETASMLFRMEGCRTISINARVGLNRMEGRSKTG